MKTKIKRHSRAVLSIVLTLCMLVSCMTVGIIATDAAKVTDSDRAIGAKADSEDDALGAKDDSEAAGYNSNATGYLQSSSGTPITDVTGTGAASGTITFTVSSYQGSFLRFYIKADNGDQFGINNSSTTNNYLSDGTNNWNLAKGNYVAYYKVGANAETVTFTYSSLDGSPQISVSETTGSGGGGGGGSGSTTTDTVNQTSGTTMLVAAFTDSNDKYYGNPGVHMWNSDGTGDITSNFPAMSSANYNGVHYYKPAQNKVSDSGYIKYAILKQSGSWNEAWERQNDSDFTKGVQWVAWRTSSNGGGTFETFDALKIKSIEYPNLIASGSAASIKIKADGGFPKFYYDTLSNTSDGKKYKLTVTNKSGTKIVDAQTFKYHADSGEYSFDWTPSSTADNQLTFTLSDDDGIDTVTYTKTFTVGYGVTISAGAGGSVSPSGTKAIGSTAISITATPNTGYAFSNWTTTGGASVASSTSASTTVTASAEGTVKANFTKNSYTLSKGTETNGTFTLTPAPGSVAYNTAVTVTPSPAEGYVVTNVQYTSGSTTETVGKTNGKYVFYMPAGNTTVNVTFAQKGYQVVSNGHYSSDQYAMKELTNGMFITTTTVPATHWFKIVNTATNQISKGNNSGGGQDLTKDTLYDVTSWEAKPGSWAPNGSFDNNSGVAAYVVYDPANDQVYLTTESDGMFSTYYVYLKNGTVRWDSENNRWATDTTAYFGTTTLESTGTTSSVTAATISGNYDGKVKKVTLTAAQVRNGVDLHIKTTVNSAKQSAWYVTGFDVNGGLTQGIISQEFDENGNALATGSYVDDPQAGTKIAGHYNDFTLKINGEDLPEKNIEVTPIYFPLASNSDDFVRFYAYDFTDDVKDIWGGSLAVYPYIQGGWAPYGTYPGQLMVFEGGSYYSDIPATDSNDVPMDGLTMNNYIFDKVHYDLFYGSNQDQQHYQTYDYNEFKIINDIIQKSNSDEDIIFSFKYKDSKSLDESNLGRSTYYQDSESLTGYDYTYDYRNGYSNLDPDDPQYQFEDLTDFYGNRVDIFDQLVDVDGNETKEGYNPILIISNGYDYSAIGKYATAWALYVPKDASGNDAFTRAVDHYELFEVYGGQGMNTHQSESYLINPDFALSIRCKYGDTAHLAQYQQKFREAYPDKTVPTHIRDCEYIPVKISYEYEGYSGKSNLNLEGETQNGNVSNRSDGRWYYSSSDRLLNSHTIIEVADSINGTFTRDYYQNGIDYTSDSGYDPAYNTGLGTGVKAYFTNDNRVEYGTGTYYQNVDGNTRAYAISDGKSMHNYKLKAEEDPNGNYTFVGWYRLTDTGSGTGYTIASEDLEFETQAKTNDVYVARFVKVPSGTLNISHSLTTDSRGSATCSAKAEILASNGTTVEDSTSYPYTEGTLKIGSKYIKSTSDKYIRITIKTELGANTLFDKFKEKITTTDLGELIAGSGKLGITATVAIDTSSTDKTATITFPINKLFTTSDGETTQTVKSLPFYSKTSLPAYQYEITYNFGSRKLIQNGKLSDNRLWGNQFYKYKGTFTDEEVEQYLDLSGTPTFKSAETANYLAEHSPYEKNFLEDTVWDFNSQTISYNASTLTFSCSLTAAQTTNTDINVTFKLPFDYTLNTTTPNNYTFSVTKASETDKPVYKDYKTVTQHESVTMDFLDWFSLNGVKNKTQMTSENQPEFLKVPDVLYNDATNPTKKRTFKYWAFFKEGDNIDTAEPYQKCYSSALNQAVYQDTVFYPVYTAELEMSAEEIKEVASNKSATITFLGVTRDQWNYNGGNAANSIWGSKFADRIFTDFVLSFEYENKLIPTNNATFRTGLIIQTLDTPEGGIENAKPESLAAEYASSDGKDAAITKIKNTASDISESGVGNYLISYNQQALDDRNAIEYYYGIANVSQSTNPTNDTYTNPTTRRNFGYRAYSFIKKGTGSSAEVIISDPVYFTIYDVASIQNGSEQVASGS